MSNLHPRHIAHLDESAISPEIRAERGYFTAETMKEWLATGGSDVGNQRNMPALGLPVYRLGIATPYAIISKPDTPWPNADGKTHKYDWPKGKKPCLDLLPRFREALADISIPLWFTEGTKKADALASLGYDQDILPISINGVWGWRKRNADEVSIPLYDFDQIKIKGRDVVLAFDSDYATNEKVGGALEALTEELTRRGARVGRLLLPHHPDGGKLGVDDAIYLGRMYEDLVALIDWVPALAAPASTFPKLPEEAQLPVELGADACPWLDAYIEYSRKWSPRSYDGFHEACGLWLLSTIAARRVSVTFGKVRFTSLYIALSGASSVWAKTSAADIARDTMAAAGLNQLLAPDTSTPQAFLKELAENVPTGYGDAPPEIQAKQRASQAFAGQRGWFHEEFGSHIAAMMREGGIMADFRGHLRVLDDCPAEYSYNTISRGLSIIKRPYLALLACLTPDDLKPHAKKGSQLWGDGYFARFAFISPSSTDKRSRARFPDGNRRIPNAIREPLHHWHERLGIPTVEITELRDATGKSTGIPHITVTPVTPQDYACEGEIKEAYYQYLDSLLELAEASGNADLNGNYARLPEKALRIATLLASVNNDEKIEMRHWARAQQITERWRESLHNLVEQLGHGEASPERTREDKIEALFKRHETLTAREVGRQLRISSSEADRILDQMVKVHTLQVESTKRSKRYRVKELSHAKTNRNPDIAAPGGREPKVSQPSYVTTVTTTKNCDSSEVNSQVSQPSYVTTVTTIKNCDSWKEEGAASESCHNFSTTFDPLTCDTCDTCEIGALGETITPFTLSETAVTVATLPPEVVTKAPLPPGYSVTSAGSRYCLHYPNGSATWHINHAEAVEYAQSQVELVETS